MRVLALLATATMLTVSFSGCIIESLEVALRVPAGTTERITGQRVIEGSIYVEAGGRLVIEDADVRIAQALVLGAGVLEVRDSILRFEGPFQRHEMILAGNATLERGDLRSLGTMLVTGGVTRMTNVTLESDQVVVDNGELVAEGGAWSLHVRGIDSFGGVSVMDGVAWLGNLTLSTPGDAPALLVNRGELTAWRVATSRVGADAVRNVGGTIRLVDALLPPGWQSGFLAQKGRTEVLWTVEAQAVSPPGNLPVGGLNLTLRSAHAPTQVSSSAVTDEEGRATLVALEYAFEGGRSVSGNPHVVQADDGGKRGASPAFVVERPTQVMVPVLG